MTLPLDPVAFERFLRLTAARVEIYAESTIRNIVREAKTAMTAYSEGRPFAVRPAVKQALGRISAYAALTPGAVEPVFHTACLHYLEAKRHVKTKRKSAPRSIDATTWARLVQHIEADASDEARVLEVMAATGLRIGDVLRVNRIELTHGLRTGMMEVTYKGDEKNNYSVEGARRAWLRLQALWEKNAPNAKNVAEWISPGGGGSWMPGDAAYSRVRNHMRASCVLLDITERVWLHRFRRTVAVAALDETGGDIVAVQKLLGQRSIASTQKYTDEQDAAATGALQQRLRKRFGGET